MAMLKHLKFGFTVVELLIVMVVIGIVASVGTLGYRGVQARAANTQSTSDTTDIAEKLELYFAKYNEFPQDPDNYTVALGTFKLQPTTQVSSYDSNGISYCLSVTNTRSGSKSFTIRDDKNIAEGDCNGWIPAVASQGTGGGGSGGGTTPPPSDPPAPSPGGLTLSYTTARVRVGSDYVQRYNITASGGSCSSGTIERKMGVTGGSSAPWSSWPWQTATTRQQDIPENGIYSPVDTTIYAKARCVLGTQTTEGPTSTMYNGNGGGTGGSI